jgi:hypothetical protein
MQPTEAPSGSHNSATPADQAAVRDQLDRVLASPSFRTSKRHSGFLRYVVEATLEGRAAQLKERTVGIHVFGREPDYDTNVDPVVRVSAGELRKRVAQYYHEPGREAELRIDLPPGSYVPEFRPVGRSVAVTSPAPPASPARRSKPARLVAAGAAVACLGFVLWLRPWVPKNAFAQFWDPVWDAPGAVVISVPGHPSQVGQMQVALSDAIALAKLTPVLKSNGKEFRILTQGATTLADLQAGPVVLIGAFSNALTLRLMGEARFTFEFDPEANLPWVRDRQNPSNRTWQLNRNRSDPSADFTDYAIVSRVLDPTTDRIAVVAAGISGYATVAAGDFLSNPEYMEAINRQAPKYWRAKNVQVVVTMKISQGKPGPPRVLATYFW